MNPFYWRADRILRARLRIQPSAAQNQFAGPVGDRMKVRVKSAPVDGKANKMLIAFLAKSFRVPRSRVRLVSGPAGRNKVVEVQEPVRIPEEILAYVDSTGQE